MTNCDLLQMLKEHQFLEDLYYRLANITIKLPPLAKRGSDLDLIAQDLLKNKLCFSFVRSFR